MTGCKDKTSVNLLDAQPGHNSLINGEWYAEAPVPPLMHCFGTPKDEDAPLVLKEPDDGAP